MDPTEPNPVKTTDELLCRIRQEFPKLFTAALQEDGGAAPTTHPFVQVGPNGHPEQLVVSFFYQGGLAHMLLDSDHGVDFLAQHLELVYLCSEVHNRWFRDYAEAPQIVEDREEIGSPSGTREQPLSQAKLVVRACTSDPETVHIEFHPRGEAG